MSTSDMNTNSDFEPYHKYTEIAAPQQVSPVNYEGLIERNAPPPPAISDCGIIRCGELLNNFQSGKLKTEYIFNGLIQSGILAALVGTSDIGKSTLLLNLAIKVVTGNDFLGFVNVAKHKRVIYVSTEDGEVSFAERLNKIAPNVQREILNNIILIYYHENLLETLSTLLQANPACLVILDCFSDLYGENLNDSGKMRTFMNACQNEVCSKHGATVMFLHHTGKRTENSLPSKNNINGGQGFEAKCRLIMELKADTNVNADNIRHLCIVKANYLSGKEKKASYELEFNEDNLTFEFTGERTAFADLASPLPDRMRSNSKIDNPKFIELVKQGLVDKTAKQLAIELKGTENELSERKIGEIKQKHLS